MCFITAGCRHSTVTVSSISCCPAVCIKPAGAPLTPFPWEVDALQSPSVAAAAAAADAVGSAGGPRVLDLFGWPADQLTPPAAAPDTDEAPAGAAMALPTSTQHDGNVVPQAAALQAALAWDLDSTQLRGGRCACKASCATHQARESVTHACCAGGCIGHVCLARLDQLTPCRQDVGNNVGNQWQTRI